MKMSEGEYHLIYNRLSSTMLEDIGFPTNFNLLTHEQLQLISSTIDKTMERYANGYIELLESFREDLSTLSSQAKEVIDDLNS